MIRVTGTHLEKTLQNQLFLGGQPGQAPRDARCSSSSRASPPRRRPHRRSIPSFTAALPAVAYNRAPAATRIAYPRCAARHQALVASSSATGSSPSASANPQRASTAMIGSAPGGGQPTCQASRSSTATALKSPPCKCRMTLVRQHKTPKTLFTLRAQCDFYATRG